MTTIDKNHFDQYFKARREADNLYIPMRNAMHAIAESLIPREYAVEQIVVGSQHTTVVYRNRFYTDRQKLSFDFDSTLLFDGTEEKLLAHKQKIGAVLKALR